MSLRAALPGAVGWRGMIASTLDRLSGESHVAVARSAHPAAPRLRLRAALPYVALGVLGALLAWFRLPSIAHDTLWAEDGRLFIANAESDKNLGDLFAPYAGYLQFVPRIIAIAVVHTLPVQWWAYGMTAGACLVTGAVAVVVGVASRDVVKSRFLRVVLGAIVVLVPLGPRDVLGNPTNLHSVLMWMTVWILLFTPRSRSSAVTMSIIGFAAAASEIQVVFLVPMMILAVRRPFGRILVAGPALGVLLQIIATLSAPRPMPHSPQDSPASIALGYLINAVVPNVLPQSEIGPFVADGGLVIAGALLILLVALCWFAWRYATKRARAAIIVSAAVSVAVWTASVVDNPAPYYDYASLTRSELSAVWLTRYGVVPAMLLLGIAVIAADTLMRSSPRMSVTRPLAVVTIVAVCLCLTANYFPTFTRRSAGPTWSTQVAAAERACDADPRLTSVELNETLGWHVPVDCVYLQASPDEGYALPPVSTGAKNSATPAAASASGSTSATYWSGRTTTTTPSRETPHTSKMSSSGFTE